MREFDRETVLDAFAGECSQLEKAMAAVPDEQFRWPTPCEPWTVFELLAHVHTGVVRPVEWLRAPVPEVPEVGAAGYYQTPRVFTPQINAERIAAARQDAAAFPSGRRLLEAFVQEWRHTYSVVRGQPLDRRIATRHGHSMYLTDFMVTRVTEVALHGLDLSKALRRDPWLDPRATAVVLDLVLQATGLLRPPSLWSRFELICKATGRLPMAPSDRETLRCYGARAFTLT